MKYYILSYKRAPIGESGEPCHSTYELTSACTTCGTGAILVGNLRVKGLSKVNKELFETLDEDCIISKKLYEALLENEINLGTLLNIVDHRGNDLPFFHLYTIKHLPQTKSNDFEIEGQCPTCKRNGFFTKVVISTDDQTPTKIFPYNLHYSADVLNVLQKQDFIFTWECMGLSNLKACDKYVVRYARPLLIISEKFKIALEILKIKGIEFEEVSIDKLVEM
jgi:hypothetical protein